jgi:Bacterial DNA polymerase III alpha NTPase domain
LQILKKVMIQTKFGELVFNESDICDLIMQGRDIDSLKHVVVDRSINLEELANHLERPESLLTWTFPYDSEISVPEFHASQQMLWHMPAEYKQLDIAAYILSLCTTEAELQRCGAELLLYQERELFHLLRYLKYLVDTMLANQVIWGVGRGSSVASYVLYKLGVHRIDSMYYNLDIAEFLR